jgi:hypothetical protein
MASRYDGLIDQLFSDAASRAIAHSFVTRFEASPFADRIIPAMLQEGAQVNARISAGEITPQAGRDLMMSMASDGYGLPPHIVQDGQVWLTDMVAQSGGEETEPQADASGPRAELINKLFAPQDRAAAAAFAQALDADPRSASRTEALLTEVARTTDMDARSSYDYIASFAQSIGIPSHLVAVALDAISAPAERAHEEQTFNELVGDLTPQHRAALSDAERRQAREEADQFERMMRENPAEYWKPQNQEAYRQALERSIAVPVPVAPAAPADGGPAALPATAPPAATPPLTQPAPATPGAL